MNSLVRMNVKQNARLEEIKAFFALQECLLAKGNYIIGDGPLKGEPDIYNADYSLGVEVVSVDLLESFLASHNRIRQKLFRFLDQNRKDFRIINTKKVLKRLKKSEERYNLYRRSIVEKELLELDKKEYLNSFEKLVNYKFKRLNEDGYNSCKIVGLYIDSNLSYKSFFKLEEVHAKYINIKSKHKKHFDIAIINYNNTLYNIETKQVIKQNDTSLQEQVLKNYKQKQELSQLSQNSLALQKYK